MKYIPIIFFLLCTFQVVAQNEPTVVTRHHSEVQTFNAFPQSIVHDKQGRPFIYVAAKEAGLHIYAASDMKQLEMQGRFAINNFLKLHVVDVVQEGNFLYVALGNSLGGKQTPGLGIVDVTNPEKPVLVSVWVHNKKARGAATIRVKGDYAYLGAMTEGILILSIKDKRKVSLVSKYVPYLHFPQKDPTRGAWPNAMGMDFKDNYLFLCYDAGGLRVIDIANPATPKEVGRYINPANSNRQQAYTTVVIQDSLAYVGLDYCGMEVLNISDVANIQQVSWWNPWNCHSRGNNGFNSLGHVNQMHLDTSRKLLFMSAGDSELQIVDVAAPSAPKLAGSFGYPTDELAAWGLAVYEHYVLLTYIRSAGMPFKGVWSGIKVVEWAKK